MEIYRFWTPTYEEETIAFYLTPIGSALAGTIARSQSFNRSIRLYHVWLVQPVWTKKQPMESLFSQRYRGEGLSYYFAEPQDYIKIKNTDKLAEFFKERKLPYVQGRVWTTDSMLRETVNLVRKRKEEGCIAVEMELAGVQAISDFYGFELYDFLVAGDVLIEGNYETDGLSAAKPRSGQAVSGAADSEKCIKLQCLRKKKYFRAVCRNF